MTYDYIFIRGEIYEIYKNDIDGGGCVCFDNGL